jgi:hypothetical protein
LHDHDSVSRRIELRVSVSTNAQENPCEANSAHRKPNFWAASFMIPKARPYSKVQRHIDVQRRKSQTGSREEID